MADATVHSASRAVQAVIGNRQAISDGRNQQVLFGNLEVLESKTLVPCLFDSMQPIANKLKLLAFLLRQFCDERRPAINQTNNCNRLRLHGICDE